MFKEFKEFALKGNLVDLAVAFVMGAAFVKLSTSFIEDLVMPLIGKISGGITFTDMYLNLGSKLPEGTTLDAAKKAGNAVFAYGNFITITINFFIVALVMFLVVKAISKGKALMAANEAAAVAAAPPTADQSLLTEIRDLLKHRA